MTEFDKNLRTVFGERVSEMSPNLISLLRELWDTALEMGTENPHTCGNFDPGTQGPVGPDRCEACRLLSHGE
jgi:hypothetical protein